MDNKDKQLIRALADFRQIQFKLVELYHALDLVRREYPEEFIVSHASDRLKVIVEDIRKLNQLLGWMRQLYQQVTSEQDKGESDFMAGLR